MKRHPCYVYKNTQNITENHENKKCISTNLHENEKCISENLHENEKCFSANLHENKKCCINHSDFQQKNLNEKGFVCDNKRNRN